MKNTLLTMILVLLGLCSCKKYEEGPALSFRSPETRLCRTWQVTNVVINGSPQTIEGPAVWEFRNNEVCTRTTRDPYTQQDITVNGQWSFNDDETVINITWTLAAPAISLEEDWTILKLKSNELHLRSTLYGSLVEYTLEP